MALSKEKAAKRLQAALRGYHGRKKVDKLLIAAGKSPKFKIIRQSEKVKLVLEKMGPFDYNERYEPKDAKTADK